MAALSVTTRQEAVRYALRHNPDLLATAAQLEAAKSHLTQAGARPNPILNGQVVSFNPANQSQLQILLGVTQTFQFAGQRGLKQQMAEEEIKAADLALELSKQTTTTTTKEAYNRALAAHHALDLARENTDWNKQLARIAKDKVKLGELAAIEGLRADVAVAQAEQDELSARHDLEAALGQLRVAMGHIEPIEVPPAKRYEIALLPLPPVNRLIQEGLQHRPEVAIAAANLRHEAYNERMARVASNPSVDLTFGGVTNSGVPGYGLGVPGATDSVLPGAQFGFAYTLPLWYRQDGEIAQSVATQKALQLTQQSTENSLRAQIEETHGRVTLAESQIKLFQTQLMPNAERLLEQTRQRYLYGDASGRELQEARKTLREVKIAYSRAYLDYRNSLADLEASIGRELDLPVE